MTDRAMGVPLLQESQHDATSSEPAAFSFRGVSKEFRSPDGAPFVAVKDLDLDVHESTFTCVIGPSGCGKSTLLNMAAGLYKPSTGKVLYRGEQIRKVNTTVGYMTQHDTLLPWRTVAKNVGVALEIAGVGRKERQRRVDEVIERVGLAGFGGYFPSQVSGGMRKRAMLARTLIYNPRTLLMDEPFGALDAILRASMQQDLLQLWREDRRTVIFVTHDLDEALLLGDTIVVFGTKPGRIIHVEKGPDRRPSSLADVRTNPEFQDTWERLWRLINEQTHPTRVEQ